MSAKRGANTPPWPAGTDPPSLRGNRRRPNPSPLIGPGRGVEPHHHAHRVPAPPLAGTPPPNGDKVRIVAGILLGAAAGVTATVLTRRYVGAFLWWLFTADVRSPR